MQGADIKAYSQQSMMWLRSPESLGASDLSFAAMTLRWDTRDDPSLPTSGVLHEWSYERSDNSTTGALAGSAAAYRLTFVDSRYYRVWHRVSLALRNLFEVLEGDVPMDLYGEIGDSLRRLEGLGGNNTIRGYALHRFMDDVRLLSNTELRYQIASTWLVQQFLQWQLVLFTDAGRVWPDLDSVSAGGFHASTGAGIRLIWNRDFAMRFETAHTGEGDTALFSLNHSF